MLKRSKLLIDALNDNNIPWVIYKGKYHYPDGFDGIGDADILIDESKINEAHCILHETGCIQVVTQTYLCRNGVEDWMGFDDNTGKLIHIHLHTKIVFGDSFLDQYRFKLDNRCLMCNDVDTEGIHSQNVILESILIICMYARKSISMKKLLMYRGVISTNYFDLIEDDMFGFLNNEDKTILYDFYGGPLRHNRRLIEFADKFCEVDVNNWRIEKARRLLIYKVSRLINS